MDAVLDPRQRGRLVATVLAGSWRRSPPDITISSDALAVVAPILLASGAGGLGWWRVRHSKVQRSSAGFDLQQAYRYQSILAALHERQIRDTLAIFRASKVEPLLVKGWAVARLYPELGLRGYGDIDLLVHPDDAAAGAIARARAIGDGHPVDLHIGLRFLRDRLWPDVWRRSMSVEVGGTRVRIPGHEDHLRLLCLHLLSHGAWRPVWLCDLGVVLESSAENFDWDYFVSGDRVWSRFAITTLLLAHQLLGLPLDATPLAKREPLIPSWLVAATLDHWGREHRHREPLIHHLRTRTGILEALRRSWPDPITATSELRGPMNALPRLPFQLTQCARRMAQISSEVIAGALALT